jgi:hypothetical protein
MISEPDHIRDSWPTVLTEPLFDKISLIEDREEDRRVKEAHHPFEPPLPEHVPASSKKAISDEDGRYQRGKARTVVRSAIVGGRERVTRQYSWGSVRISSTLCIWKSAKIEKGESFTHSMNTCARVYVLEGDLEFKEGPLYKTIANVRRYGQKES